MGFQHSSWAVQKSMSATQADASWLYVYFSEINGRMILLCILLLHMPPPAEQSRHHGTYSSVISQHVVANGVRETYW